ncbi:ribosome small subunit-dependent GTPase A [Phenylobacterium sp.]|uniref:ribosome small subunit-dependent GTPase A n=1 Tax=Phenylobacterium sp. TaxID=1871053 RepID=UPI002E348E78|nr:ribosome small subunit-dependent GTPase A [Phenylobacterium sp.]HEX2561561.1 ribosome small subunit-dependent GTPase A [Phenylobacterium sp.]
MLITYGWSDQLQQDFAPFAAQGLSPARVVLQQRGRFGLVTAAGEVLGAPSGKLQHEAGPGGYPVAGDWVAILPPEGDGLAVIRQVMPRRTEFVRKAAGTGEAPQVVAANIDLAFLVLGLDDDFNLRRLERYLAAAWESGARPVVLLTKADSREDLEGVVAETQQVALGVDILPVSAVTGEGLDEVRHRLGPGLTAVLIGMSGVGKSTLVNALLGEQRLATGEVRETDGRGKHTTTHRELVLLPGGGLILDTPGMRELAFWDPGGGVSTAFAEVEALADQCRFRDCRHETEPGCAVRAAREAGELGEDRWRGYVKLQRELGHLDRKEDPVAREAWRKRWIHVAKANRKRGRGREPEAEE